MASQQYQQSRQSLYNARVDYPTPQASSGAARSRAGSNNQVHFSPVSASPDHGNPFDFSSFPSSWQGQGHLSVSQTQGYQTSNNAQLDINEINNLVAAHGNRDAAPWAATADHRPSLPLPNNSFPGAPASFSASVNGPGNLTLDSAYQSQYGSSPGSLPNFGSRILHNFPAGPSPFAGSHARNDRPESVTSDPLNGGARQRASGDPARGRNRSRGEEMRCPFLQGCPKMLKNRSELEKHRLQHDRPFRCDMPACTRTDGFATPNDLDRHRTSVHGARARIGRATGHICQACPPPAPGTRPKFWPRRDNFKAHIRRKHRGCDIDYLVRISESERPDDAVTEITESGYASQDYHDEMHVEHDLGTMIGPDYIGEPFQQGDFSLFSTGGGVDELAGVGGQIADGLARHERFTGFHGSNTIFPNEQSAPRAMEPELKLASPAAPSNKSPLTPTVLLNGSPFEYAYQDCSSPTSSSQQWPMQVSGLLKRESMSSNDGAVSRLSSVQEFVCPQLGCGKIKKRECDLRKHIKRHSRPYGCTFPLCYKRFGSRNDWKRHESSQHFLIDQWRCELDRGRGNKCGQLFYRENSFQNHIKSAHSLAQLEESSLQDAASSMHLGREAHFRFWCGFCDRLVPQDSSNAPEGRFKHLGDHFDKGDDIKDWVCIEFNKKQRFITKEDKQEARRREEMAVIDEERNRGASGILDLPSCIPLDTESMLPPCTVGKDQPDRSARTSNKRRGVDVAEDAQGISDDEI